MEPRALLSKLPERVYLKSVDQYSLSKTLTCGQFFRYEMIGYGEEDGFIVQAMDKVCAARQVGSRELELALLSDGVDDSTRWWSNFFNLEQPTGATVTRMEQTNPWLKKAARSADGIHILRQDPWEALITFLISQNNNMVRIRSTVKLLSEKLGVWNPIGFHAFPEPEAILYGELEGLGLGYRLGYLQRAAHQVVNGTIDLAQLKAPGCPLDRALSRLQTMSGIGHKVANCVALYGLGHSNAFPVDVWITRALAKAGFTARDAKEQWPDAGLLQQYMFYYITHDGGALN